MKEKRVIRDQHFMRDSKIMERIVQLSEPSKRETVVEIGAGDGRLTEKLSAVFGRVIAIEIDRGFAKELERLSEERGNIKVVAGNALDLIGRDLTETDKIVSNLPYAISEPLLRRLMGFRFKMAVLTLPLGFIKRVMAKKNERRFSKLSFLSRVFFDIEMAGHVPHTAFEPPPKTDSAIAVIRPKKKGVLHAFLLREKMLAKNALREALCEIAGLTKRQAKERISSMDIPKNILEKRVRDLKIEEMESVKSSVMD